MGSDINVSEYKYQFLRVAFSDETSGVLKIGLNRPEKRNAFNLKLFHEYHDCFKKIKNDDRISCVIVYGEGNMFCSGIDYKEIFQPQEESIDPARQAKKYNDLLDMLQASVSSVENCSKPVIMLVHGHCIGLGLELILAGDIRICTIDCKFSVKEVDLGLAADVGALQRLPKVVGNHSWVREVCLTAKTFEGSEAERVGLVSKAFTNFESLLEHALNIAITIASKSPIAVYGTKHLLNYSRDNSVNEGLAYTRAWNGAMLQTEDIPNAITGHMMKSAPKFSKL